MGLKKLKEKEEIDEKGKDDDDNDPYEHLDYLYTKYLEDVEDPRDTGNGPYHTDDPRDDWSDALCYEDDGYGSNYDGGYDSY